MIRKLSNCILGSLIILLAAGTVSAQPVAKIGYFMDNATHKHLMNPALVPARGYISYPGLGSFDLDLRSNLSVPQFIFPQASGKPLNFLHENVTADEFLSQLSPNNYLKMNQRLSLFGIGTYIGRSFWTFEVASRIDARMSIPYEFFAFLKKGMDNAQGNTYAIRDLKIGMSALAETSLGASFMIGDNIRVGAKGKLLAGGGKVEAGLDELDIEMRPDKWTVSSKGMVNMYGAGFEFIENQDGYVDDFDYGTPNMAGLGYAFDLGASWKPLEFLEVSAGIIDLGKVSWNKTYNRVARASGTATFNGMENISLEDDGTEEDPFQEISDNLMKMAQFKETNESENQIESLVPTLNAGVEAGIWSNRLSLGLLYSNRMIPDNPLQEITGVLNFKPLKGFNIAGSYSLLNGVQETFGLALGVNLLIANLFVACDYIPTRIATGMPVPLTQATTHLQIGASISLGKMKTKK